MTKIKSTKRALLLSAVSILLCASMFVGTTFAWFTDTVSSGRNIIKSGNLDVELYYFDEVANDWTKVTSETNVFGYDLWEPGHTRVIKFKVVNEGSLALKYQLTADVFQETAGVNKDEDTFLLSDYLYTKVVDKDADRDDILAIKDGYKFRGSIPMSEMGELEAAKENEESADEIALAIWMPTSVGNEANHDGKNVPTIEFGINLVATQLVSEEDSFGNDYDIKATYLNQDADGAWLINNMDELYYFASDVNGGNTYNGETVKLTADIDLAGYNWTPIGQPGPAGTTDFSSSFRGTFDGQEHTVSNVKVSNEGWAGLFGLAYKATIKNVNVKGATLNSNRMTGAVVGQLYGNIENCHVINANIVLVPNAVTGGYDNGDKVGGIVGWLGDNGNNHYIKGCTATNVTIKGYRDIGGIAGYIGSSTTVENCKADTVTITVDQATNHYGNKDTNAGGIVGRIYNQPVTLQNNTETNVTLIVPTFVSTADTLVAALTAGDNIVLIDDVAIDTNTTVTIASGVSSILNLNGHKISATANNSGNQEVFLVKGNMTVNNGSLELTAENNQGWNAMATIFDVTAGGVLNLDGVTTDVTGTDMTFVVHLNNWGTATLNAKNSTLKASYIPVRAFNSGYDMNNITIENCTLEGKYCFWVHNYTSEGKDDSTLNVDIYGNGNTFVNSGKAPVLYGFDNTIYFDANGNEIVFASASTQDDLNKAIENNSSVITLGAGEYIIPDSAKGKTMTIIGNGDTTIAVQDDGSSEGDIDYSFDGSNVTFENVTLNIKGSDHPGYARMSAVYNDCTIVGSNYTLYGDSVFNNCTFNLNNGYVWTWGAAKVEFNGCTFEDKVGGKAKAILVHNTTETVVTVKDCTFIATTPAETWDKIPVAAVSVDPENGSPDATVHFVGTNTFSDAFYALYQVKYADEVDDVTITVDGVEQTVTAMK